MSPATPKVIDTHQSSSRLVGLLTILASVILIAMGALGLLAVQEPLRVSQDTRGEAMISDGEARVSVVQATNTSLKVYQPARLDFRINSGNTAIKGVKLVFNVVTSTTDVITFQTYSDSNFEIISQEIQGTGDGFLVAFEARPRSGTFSSTTDRSILSLEFVPQRTGDVKISFDQTNSVALRVDNDQDTLRSVGQQTFTIDSSTISSAGKSCNETCSNNGECQANYRCYDSRCRLVTNPSSDSCVTPPDNGLQRQCNEYCADTRECASGFTCFFNRCRQPGNPDSVSCQATSAQVQSQIAQNCNKSCASNADCANNLRCFQSQCRLATNPSSTSCSPLTRPVVSQTYYSVTEPTKGELGAADLVTPTPRATGSATTSPRPTTSPSPTPSPIVMPEPTQPGPFNFSWPLLALAAGVILLILVILSSLIGIFRRGSSSGSRSAMKNAPTGYETELQAKIDQLKNQQPVSRPMPVTPPSTTPTPMPVIQSPVTPPVTQTQPVTPPVPSVPRQPQMTPPPSTMRTMAAPTVKPPTVQPLQPKPVASPLPTTQAAVAPSAARTSSMIEKIREKSITPPGQNVDIFNQKKSQS